MAGKTLIKTLPDFKNQLYNCLKDSMYETWMATLESGDNVDPSITATIQKDMDIAAKKYSEVFAARLAPPLSQAIYNFIMEIGINLTPKGSLMAPQATTGILPVTGSASTTTQDITVF